MRNAQSGTVREGLECRFGVITRERPVHFHKHHNGHWLTACGLIKVETEHYGTFILKAGETMFVEAEEEHKLSVEHDTAGYSCVGKAPL